MIHFGRIRVFAQADLVSVSAFKCIPFYSSIDSSVCLRGKIFDPKACDWIQS